MGRNKFINSSQLKFKFIIPIYMYILNRAQLNLRGRSSKKVELIAGASALARAERRLQHVYTNKRYLSY